MQEDSQQKQQLEVVKPIKGKLFNGDEIILKTEQDENIGRFNKVKNLIIENQQYINNNKYQSSDQCNVCQIFQDNLSNCAVCGGATCNPCIRRQINEIPTCDICFLRAFTRHKRSQQISLLQSKQKQAEQLKQKTNELQQNISQIEQDIQNKQMSDDSGEGVLISIQKKIEKTQQELEIKSNQHELKMEEITQLNGDLDREFNNIYRLQAQETQLDAQISQYQTSLGMKEQNFQSLSKQQKKIINSKSYLNYLKTSTQEEQQNENEVLLEPENNQKQKIGQNRKGSKDHYKESLLSEYPDKLSLMEREKPMKETPEGTCNCQIF